MKKKNKFFLMLCCCCTIFLWGFNVNATSWDVTNILGDYGNLDQDLLTEFTDGINYACGPVAALNSLLYLQNTYSAYGTSLVPDSNTNGSIDTAEMLAVARILADSSHMNTRISIGGTYENDFVSGKQLYIEEVVPGLTNYGNQMSSVTADFMGGALNNDADLEILVNGNYDWDDDGDDDYWGHFLTIYSLVWDDTTNMGTIGYVDPMNPDISAPGQTTNIWLGTSGLETDFSFWPGVSSNVAGAYWQDWNGTSPPDDEEPPPDNGEPPPVPEPATMFLLGTSLLGLAYFSKKRKRS